MPRWRRGRTALDAFGRLGADPWVRQTGAALRAAGQHAPLGRPAGAADLTPKEREVAALAAAGLSNKEIGRQLFLSHRTVSDHLHKVFPKLGITSQAALGDALEALGSED